MIFLGMKLGDSRALLMRARSRVLAVALAGSVGCSSSPRPSSTAHPVIPSWRGIRLGSEALVELDEDDL